MTTDNSRDEFAKDREVCDAATPGEWVVVPPTHYYHSRVGVVGDDGRTYTHSHAMTIADAEFVARAHQRWPAALVEIERLTKLVEKMRAEALRESDRDQTLLTDAMAALGWDGPGALRKRLDLAKRIAERLDE